MAGRVLYLPVSFQYRSISAIVNILSDAKLVGFANSPVRGQ